MRQSNWILFNRARTAVVTDVLRPYGLLKSTLFVLDSLYGDGPTLEQCAAWPARSGLEEVVWNLYSRKQALENQWNELLADLGLHHPPCARAAVNALFYGVAALAYNLA